MSTPPPVGKTLSVKVDQQLYDDLTTMLATGMTVSDAVRTAMLVTAGTYRQAWDTGRCPARVRPTIERYWIARYDAGQKPGDPVPQQLVPTPYVVGATRRPTITPPPVTPGAPGPTFVRRSV